ncbi:MAG TPA: Uma2 family endonuclease [Gemmataceae bacterium]|jgi:Uma2 family endonuclease|nr:Uma2 family endonuclease [Gemmataceae bacterium]
MSKILTRNGIKRGEPAWGIAELYPEQGGWDEEEYLDLPGNRLVEFDNGFIEVLPVPTTSHHTILAFLYNVLLAFTQPAELGKVYFAGIPVRLWKGKFREPDILFMLARHADRIGEKFWRGADLVMEIVSADPESRKRDIRDKRRDYARARIPEYWIIDPQKLEITVLRLSQGKYLVHGKFGKGETASSHLLKGFEVAVDTVFSQS